VAIFNATQAAEHNMHKSSLFVIHSSEDCFWQISAIELYVRGIGPLHN
jgi:hypothetical protein